LFYVWLLGKEDDESPVSAAKGTLLLPNEFGPIQLQPEDYLGTYDSDIQLYTRNI
tara:strand:+ start:385 stop:549 length:165 start_codon:yes stop_codon:yes gene_type:complete